MSILFYLSFPLLGFGVGFMAGLLGIGGGAIMVPALTALFLHEGLPVTKAVHLALGTSMAVIIVTTLTSSLSHHKKGSILIDVIKWLAPSVAIGAFLATFIVPYISPVLLSSLFSVFLIYVAVSFLRDKKISSTSKEQLLNKELVPVGFGIGALSALVSIGGGTMTVPYLTNRGVALVKAIGTSSVVGFCLSITGSIGYMLNGWQYSDFARGQLGFVDLPVMLVLAIASVITAPFGVRIAHRLPVGVLKKILAVFLLILAVQMMISVISAT
ncbi:MAG: sulfite exporter TauE/SafE family protein [Cellvibrionales bacterium]|nr:sulfite exporter TauE/SafE family protein [Cellvibrionales bacterium]